MTSNQKTPKQTALETVIHALRSWNGPSESSRKASAFVMRLTMALPDEANLADILHLIAKNYTLESQGDVESDLWDLHILFPYIKRPLTQNQVDDYLSAQSS